MPTCPKFEEAYKIQIVDMEVLQWICDHTLKDTSKSYMVWNLHFKNKHEAVVIRSGIRKQRGSPSNK